MKRFLIIVSFCWLSVISVMAQLNTDRLISIGRNALYFEDYVLSIQYFNQVIKAKPFLVEPYFYRAIAKIQLEDFSGAENDLDLVIERNPFIPMAFYARGYSYKRQGRWNDAILDMNKALEFSPENFFYIINRIELFEQIKDWDMALADVTGLLKKSPNSIELNFEKGRLLFEKRDTVAALKCFDDMVNLDSTNSDTWAAKGLAYLITEDNATALEAYNKAVGLKSSNPSTYINRGILNYRIKDYNRALSDYDRAIELDSIDLQARFNRALLRNEVGDYETALRDLSFIISRDNEADEALYQRAVINSQLGNMKVAIEDLNIIVKKFPNFIPAIYIRADLYEKMGEDKLAFIDRENAFKIKEEQKKKRENGSINSDSIDVSLKVAKNDDDNLIKSRAGLFAANAGDLVSAENLRGNIQNLNYNLENEPNFLLTYYKEEDDNLINSDYIHSSLQRLNNMRNLQGDLYLVNREVKLSENLINIHFVLTQRLSNQIANTPYDSYLYLARGIEYALIQDFENAIEDFSKAIFYGEDVALIYFCRANVRYKQLEFTIHNQDDFLDDKEKKSVGKYDVVNGLINDKTIENKKYSHEFEMIMRDYDKVIELLPDFAFSWFNRANMLALQKDYQAALLNYTKAIELMPELGEAYYNRGLTYIYLGNSEKGIADLSKAGELGIYKAYNALKRVQNVIYKK